MPFFLVQTFNIYALSAALVSLETSELARLIGLVCGQNTELPIAMNGRSFGGY
jgi:hypothetical protein